MSVGLLLVDDHVAIAEALVTAFRDVGFEPVEHLRADELSPEHALAVARRLEPDVALVDLNLGAGRSGLPLISALVGAGVPVVAFSAHDDEVLVANAVEAGAIGFFNKAEAFDVIADHVERAARGEVLLSAQRRAELVRIAQAARAGQDATLRVFDTLTPREQAVLDHLMQGRSAQQIAEIDITSVRTVRKQIEAVRAKLGVRSQLAAVAMARDAGWHLR